MTFKRRISQAERISMRNRADVEIQRFAKPDPATGLKPHALWHKHVHNVTLDPVQILKMNEMDLHSQTIDFSCRRTGKTAVKELYILEKLATLPHQDCGIVAPRQQQSLTNLSYHLEAIQRSPILTGFLGFRNGRPLRNESGYEFDNQSGAAAYGIMSQIDGDSLTIASLEETDDMPHSRLVNNFLPMLGAARRLGSDRDASNFRPDVRITGVFKGADVLQSMIATGLYHCLPAVDIYLGMELGIINAQFMMKMREELTSHEFARQFLCVNKSSTNWIWEKHVRRAMGVGLQAGLTPAAPLPGARYKRRGLVAFGYDHLGHGEGEHASKSALVVTELVGNYFTFPFVKTWGAGTDDKVVELDLLGLWSYFRPDYAIGDAYGVGMLTSLNDRLFTQGLTEVDRCTVGDGQSTASTWTQWPFAPLRFEGMTKHSMAAALRSAFHNGQAAIPFVEEMAPAFERDQKIVVLPARADDALVRDFMAFMKQLINIRAVPTKTSYSSFKMSDTKIGDDLFDAAMAAVWAITTRGLADMPTSIVTRTATREQLLGAPSMFGALVNREAA